MSSTTRTDNRDVTRNGPSDFGEELCHIVPPNDVDRALCGKDVTGFPWNPPWPMCVVCVDLAKPQRHGP